MKRWVAVMLAGVALSATSLHADESMDPGIMGEKDAQTMHQKMGQELGLNDQQKAQLENIRKSHQESMKMLMNYSWPGNIRQLENAIERAVALVGMRNIILPSDLPHEVQKTNSNLFLSEIYIPDEGVNFNTEVSYLERELILQSLKKSGGNKKQAAKLLNLKRTTLIEKLKRLDLMDEV